MLDLNNKFLVQPNSYDCDAPIDEYGRRTPKYYAEQKIICELTNQKIVNRTNDPILSKYGRAKFVESTNMLSSFEDIATYKEIAFVPTMEEVGQNSGVVLYETEFFVDKSGADLTLPICHDIASVYLDDELVFSYDRNSDEGKINVSSYGEHNLKIIVENLGRVNFGIQLKDNKGLLGDVSLYDINYGNTVFLMNWKVTSIELDKLPKLYKNDIEINKPAFYKYEINIDEVGDTILHLDGFTRGSAYINGFNLGRHFDFENCQNKLYVPRPLLKKGINTIVVFDIKANKKEKTVELIDEGLMEQL